MRTGRIGVGITVAVSVHERLQFVGGAFSPIEVKVPYFVWMVDRLCPSDPLDDGGSRFGLAFQFPTESGGRVPFNQN